MIEISKIDQAMGILRYLLSDQMIHEEMLY